ncbi:MAG: hypothetical protein FJ279_21080, partial [Planctomycetes bacterium]|nr:hypothetical protein [Planctomycetota bacterium]
MKRTLTLGFVLCGLMPLPCLAADTAKLPEVTVAACQAPVKVDGLLDEPCWQSARPLTDFRVLGLDEIARDTTVRLTYDSAWLYVAVACEHPSPPALKPGNFDHDGAVHTDESVEVFIDPGTDGRCYFHLKLNCANVKAEQRAGRDGWREPKWDSPWRSATRIHETGWNAEMAIPLYVLASHGDLKKTRMNVTRNKVVPEIDRQGVIVSEKRQLTTWAPVLKTFHEPDRFGALNGMDVANLEVPFLAGFENARISSYYVADGKYCYDVLLDVRGHNDKSGKATVTVLDQPVAGKESRLSREVEVKGMKSQPIRLPVAVDSPSQRKATVMMTEAETGATFRLARIVETSALNLMSVYLDRTYYTTEEQAVAVCSLGLPDDALRATKLVATDDKGKVLGETQEASRETQVPMKIKALDVGSHSVNIQWQQKDGRLIFSQKLTLIKRPPKPGLEWKIDKISKVILRDGRPFFPCGLI